MYLGLVLGILLIHSVAKALPFSLDPNRSATCLSASRLFVLQLRLSTTLSYIVFVFKGMQ
jgi:hypothetical protein